MEPVVKILWVLALCSASLQDVSVHGMVDFSSPWDTRVSSTLDLLQRDPCWGLSRVPKCNRSIFSNLNTRKIMLYNKQRLHCRPQLETLSFANCRARESFLYSCNPNSARCLDPPTAPSKCTYKRCNHAVLVTGGWSNDTSRLRYRNNLRNVWKLLHHTMSYQKKSIVTFFGQGRKEDLAGHQRPKSFPVKSSTVVRKYIRTICRSGPCVDTLTLYLTGPSTGDGSLLFWDNGDGITQESELYSPRHLLDDIKNCSAKRVFLVADYSYSGALINKFKNRVKRHPKQFSNLMAILSSSWEEPAWRSDFTDAFIKHNKEGITTTCVADVFQKGIQPDFHAKGAQSTPQIVQSDSSSTNTTLSGNPCNEPWMNAAAREPCKLLEIHEWKPWLTRDG